VTTSLSSEPWRGLPPEIADTIEPELDAIAGEILATIAREVPDYARPFEGSFGRGVRTGVTEALRQFLELIRDPGAGRGPGREVYVGLGRGELRQGRTLDALQSAYRVGARVAWRRIARTARGAGADPEVLSLLAESIFAYIEELSADSVEGYAEARSLVESERRRRRRALVALLLRDPPADAADLRAAAATAEWRVPRSLAPLACAEGQIELLAGRLPVDTLAAPVDGLGCLVISDPEGPGRPAEIDAAVRDTPAAVGPAAAPAALSSAWSLAQAAWRAIEAGAVKADGPVRVDDALTPLLLFQGRTLVDRLAARRLGALAGLSPKARLRMEQTALAYVQLGGNAAAMARALDVHPQTARYRLARLRELVGDELDDPDARLELELALRGRAVSRA
jgi:hypothetical protein